MELRNSIIDYELFEIIPYVKSMFLKRKYMLLSYESLLHAEHKLVEKMQTIKLEKEHELSTTGQTAWGVKDRARWNINIEGFDVDIMDYVSKGVWDFFHYARVCLDMIIQILNVTAFEPGNRKSGDLILIKDLYKQLPTGYESLKALLKDFEQDENYKYIQAADNYIKHIDTLKVSMKTKNMLSDFDAFIINDFIYGKKKYEGQVVSKITSDCKNFVINAINRFFDVFLNADTVAIKRRNIITDIKYESLTKGNITEYISFFIDVKPDSTDLKEIFGGDVIYVRPISVDKEYNIYEDKTFCFDKIFIRVSSTDRIIGIAKIDTVDETPYYKKYNVVACSNEEYSNYKTRFKDNYTRVRISNMLAFSGIEKRILQ